MRRELFTPTPVGALRIESDGRAITRIAWCDAAPAEAPCAPGAACAVLERAAIQLADYFAGRRQDFDLPLRPEGSGFQKRVWKLMKQIPYGQTMTYGEMASRLASVPRAVGGACGANPIPLVIPCHRVVAASGRLGGYSGGLGQATKRFLLMHEGALAEAKDLFSLGTV